MQFCPRRLSNLREFVLNSRHPGPRRVWNPGSEQHFSTPFPGDPGDPLDNSGRRKLAVKNNDLGKFSRKMIPQKRSQGPGASLVPPGCLLVLFGSSWVPYCASWLPLGYLLCLLGPSGFALWLCVRVFFEVSLAGVRAMVLALCFSWV